MKIYKAYTDGSHRDGKSTYAFIIVDDENNKIYEDCGFTDEIMASRIWNIAGELTAVSKAIEWAVTNDCSLHLYYDLKAVYHLAHDWVPKNRWTKAFKFFMEFYKDKIISYNYVKGHSKNIWNDYVDSLARKKLETS